MNEQTQKNSLSRFRRALFILLPISHIHSVSLEAFNIDSAKPAGTSTPFPNLDDDLGMQKYISDRRVIGVC